MNIIKYPQKECPLCESESDEFRKDFEREEVYCGVCGCVLIDNSLPSISLFEFLFSLYDDDSEDDSDEKILENSNRENPSMKPDSKSVNEDLEDE